MIDVNTIRKLQKEVESVILYAENTIEKFSSTFIGKKEYTHTLIWRGEGMLQAAANHEIYCEFLRVLLMALDKVEKNEGMTPDQAYSRLYDLAMTRFMETQRGNSSSVFDNLLDRYRHNASASIIKTIKNIDNTFLLNLR